MSNFFSPKMGCNLSSARISRLFFGFCSLCFLMCAQIFFVTSLRGSGSVPTILARCSEGRIGFINALFFGLAVVFAIFALHPYRRPAYPAMTGIVTGQMEMCGKGTLLIHSKGRVWTDLLQSVGDVQLR